MLQFLPGPVLGSVMFTLLAINTILWGIPVYIGIFAKLITPVKSWRIQILRIMMWLAESWSMTNIFISRHLLKVNFEICGVENLDRKGIYLTICNHQSWVDIVVLHRAFGRVIPFFKFFLKQELIWVPILGPIWWGLEYPFMKRYTSYMLKKHPQLHGINMETTRKACERYKDQPLALLNFPEGTRFTQEKRARQQSRYRHLLSPKAGGLAFTLLAIGERFHALLDVTIVYPDGIQGLWGFLCGRVSRIKVDVQKLSIPDKMRKGNYQKDATFRQLFRVWVNNLWKEKDDRIHRMLMEEHKSNV